MWYMTCVARFALRIEQNDVSSGPGVVRDVGLGLGRTKRSQSKKMGSLIGGRLRGGEKYVHP